MSGMLTLEGFMLHMSSVQKESTEDLKKILIDVNQKLTNIENSLQNTSNMVEEKMEKAPEPAAENMSETEMQFVQKLQDPNQVTPNTSTPKLKIKLDVPDDDSEDCTVSPYEIFCYDCETSFIRGSGEFSRHVKNSTCKPYQCHCGKLFKKRSSLNAHKSVHSTETFKCYCGAVFRCEQYLKNHKRRKHSKEGSDQGETEAKRLRLNEVQVKTEPLNDSPFDPMELLDMQMEEPTLKN